MSNVDNPHGFKFEKCLWGSPSLPLEEGITTSNTAIYAGDALVDDGNGRLKPRAGSDSTTPIVGIAAEAVSAGGAGVTGKVCFYPAVPQAVFSGQTDGDANLTDLYTGKGLVGTAGAMEIDSTGADGSQIQIIGKKYNEDWDSHADLLFVIKMSGFTGLSES